MSVGSCNRTDVLGTYTAVLKDLIEGKLFFESKDFPVKESIMSKACFNFTLQSTAELQIIE